MADSASELESDCSSIDGTSNLKTQIPTSKEQMHIRIESLQQECKVLKVELETYKLRCKNLLEENKNLRKASVSIELRKNNILKTLENSNNEKLQTELSIVDGCGQAKAEQEEEFISNMLLKKIQVLKKEKEALAMNYEQEEEFLTNDLSRKLCQLKQEKVQLEKTLEQEQELQVNKLLRKIRKLEAETSNKQANLEQLRREKIELENTLEQEQEALVNKLWKRMEKLEAEKRLLQEKLDQPVSEPPSPQPPPSGSSSYNAGATSLKVGGNHSNTTGKSEAALLTRHVQHLKNEVAKLKRQLNATKDTHYEKMDQISREEQNIKNESQCMRKKYLEEVALTRTLSESESSIDMEEDSKFMDHSPRIKGGSGQFHPFHPTQFHNTLSNSNTFNNYPSTPRARNIASPSFNLLNSNMNTTSFGANPNNSSNNNNSTGGGLNTSFLSNRSVSPMNIITCQNAHFLNKSHQHLCPNCGYSFPCPPLVPQSNFMSMDAISSTTNANLNCPKTKQRSPSAELFAKPPAPPSHSSALVTPPMTHSNSYPISTNQEASICPSTLTKHGGIASKPRQDDSAKTPPSNSFRTEKEGDSFT